WQADFRAMCRGFGGVFVDIRNADRVDRARLAIGRCHDAAIDARLFFVAARDQPIRVVSPFELMKLPAEHIGEKLHVALGIGRVEFEMNDFWHGWIGGLWS